jgi:hypothetical protein
MVREKQFGIIFDLHYVLEEKMQQLSSTHPTHTTHTTPTHTPTGDNLITPNHILSLNPIMNAGASTSGTHLSSFAYPANPSAATTGSSGHISVSSNNALPAFSYPTSTHSSSLTSINHLSMPLASTSLPISASLLITNPLTANLAVTPTPTPTTPAIATESTANTTTTTKTVVTGESDQTITTATATTTAITTSTSTIATPITTTPAEPAHIVPEVSVNVHGTQEPVALDKVPGASEAVSTEVPMTGNEKDRPEPMKAEQSEQEVRDFLTQMQKVLLSSPSQMYCFC